jgi:5,6,7,8-tetrahydromethanopterin hydro-lyase
MQIGEAFVGVGAEAAHINTVLGESDGPVGTAWATAFATPRAGHAAFVTVIRPGLAVKPATLFVNKAALAGDLHARLTWGAAQAGVAGGVVDAVAQRVVERDAIDGLVLIVAVWVDPKAENEDLVYGNNRRATAEALAAGRDGRPDLDELLRVRGEPANPFFREQQNDK